MEWFPEFLLVCSLAFEPKITTSGKTISRKFITRELFGYKSWENFVYAVMLHHTLFWLKFKQNSNNNKKFTNWKIRRKFKLSFLLHNIKFIVEMIRGKSFIKNATSSFLIAPWKNCCWNLHVVQFQALHKQLWD